MATQSLQELVDRGSARAAELGHEMQLVTSDVQMAFYRCARCQQTFTVGYPVYVGSRPAETRLELIAASVLSVPCAGHPPGAMPDPAPAIPMVSPDGNWEWNGAEWKPRAK